MNYQEFAHFKELKDKENPFSKLYETKNGDLFYIEPQFYTQMMTLKNIHKDRFNEVLLEMEIIVSENHKVIFTMDFESPITHKKDFIYQEIEDVLDRLGIFVEDKSRGSDYGD